MVSVRLGAKETMRRSGCGTRTLRPISSLTSRKAGGSVGEGMAALCARDGAAAQEKTTKVAQATTARRDGGNFLKQFPTVLARIFPKNEKAPRDARGFSGFALSREERGPLCQGRVAWLTAASSRSQWRDRGRFARPSPLPRLPIENSV